MTGEVIKLKRRVTGLALVPGTSPLGTGGGGIGSGECVWDDIASILYIGSGDDGAGNCTSVISIAGSGAFVAASLLGANSGVATLDSGGKLTTSQIPASILGAMDYVGTWNATTNSPTLVSSTGTKGAFYKVATAGTTTIDGISSWNVGDLIAFDGTVWDKIDGIASEVLSVAGRTGVVTVASTDLTDSTSAGRAILTSASVAAQRVTLGIDQRSAVADVDYTMLATDRSIAFTSITAPRVVTWIAASSVNAGDRVRIADWSGSASGSLTITMNRSGSDSLGGVGVTSQVISSAYGLFEFESDGISKWNIVNSLPAVVAAIDGGAI